ncbi:flippase [Alcaligenes sp. WGS1538]|uniref:flippase n=1 Tax=Alcaligenes sp. WGS1538 TaxID=3366811 RepID=UPI002291A900|nr:flippase [Escherichia coli]
MSLLKNSFWNLAGYATPLVIAIPAMGIIARLLGVEQFGIFTLFFAIVGYASLFDLGISRAVIRAVAMEQGDAEGIQRILGTSTLLVAASSLLAMLVIAGFNTTLVQWLSISPELHSDSAHAFSILAAILPLVLLSSVWFSYLEGISNFRLLNILRTLSGIFLAVSPLIGVSIQADLSHAVWGLFFGRLLTVVIAYFWGLPDSPKRYLLRWETSTAVALFRFGGWLTVSNVISPLMVYFDRFLLSTMNGAKVVAFYTGPAEAISRLLAIPGSVVRVIFPLLSARSGAGHETRLSYLLLSGVCGLIAVVGILLAKWILLLWLGKEFLGAAVPVLQILLVGFFFNSIAQIPYTVIQAAGHSRVTALLHLAEILPYLGLLYLFISQWGVIGAALAWTLRVGVDCLALVLLSRRYR